MNLETTDSADELQALQKRQAEALARKTEFEAQICAQQLTPSSRWLEKLKSVANASGLVLALVAVAGGLLSVGSWLLQQRKEQQIRSEERLDRALTLLADSDAAKRLSAVTSLGSFLSESNDVQNAQVLTALANALALEQSAPVRNAILSTVEDIDGKVINRKALDRGLRSFVEVNRGLVREGDVWRSRPENLNGIEQSLPVGSRLLTTGRAIVVLLRKGARYQDMSATYLGKLDMSDLDLDHTNFDESILAWANFTRASLTHSSFDGADLQDTKFASANLKGAKFVLTNKQNVAATYEDYVARDMAVSDDYMSVEMPDFSCANLEEASFAGHSIFGIAANDFPIQFNVAGPNFGHANLKNTDFRDAQVFWVSLVGDLREPFEGVPNMSGFLSSNRRIQHQFFRLMPQSRLSKQSEAFGANLNGIASGFAASNWQDAKLPQAIQEWLTRTSKDGISPNVPGLSCQRRADSDVH